MAAVKLGTALVERRSPEARNAYRLLWWEGALTSLWAPITFLAIALIPYLFIVELNTAARSWAQPVMKGLSLAMVVCFAGLGLLRLASSKFRERRRVQREAEEILAEVETALGRSKKLDAAVRERVLAQASVLDHKRIEQDSQSTGREAQKLAELAEKQLPAFRQSPVLDLLVGLLKALLVALAIRGVFIEPYRIPSGSMIPTLQVGDQIFVNKFIYGVRMPYANWVPFVIVRPPVRGDVIVFNNPVDTSEDFIKRVAGVPGDRVELRNRVVYVNGVEQTRELMDGDYSYWDMTRAGDWFFTQGQLWRENLNDHPHAVIQQPGRGGPVDQGPYIVPPEHVFVMGDNRDSSLDSRYGLGSASGQVEYVPYGNIKGKAMIIWLSLAHGGFFSNVTGSWGLTTDRLFQPVR